MRFVALHIPLILGVKVLQCNVVDAFSLYKLNKIPTVHLLKLRHSL